MSRENIDVKGRRLLQEGRVRVLKAGGPDGRIVAECRGDSGEVHVLGFDPQDMEWRCSCLARGRCSHLVGLQLVTTAPAHGPGGTFPQATEEVHPFG